MVTPYLAKVAWLTLSPPLPPYSV